MSATVASSSRRDSIPRSQWPSISEFYRDKDIFITGATGYVGKCLLETILRALPGNSKVYLLMRPKRGKSIQERIADILDKKLYSVVRAENPDAFQRVVAISGDISLPNLGISEEDEKTLSENVSVVFHLAASIQFNSTLREALQFNVLAVRSMIALCRKMEKLQSFVHVSTAYAHCNRKEIDEIHYPSKVPYDKILDLLEWMSDEQLEMLVPSLLDGRPNTYTFTKSLGESLIFTEAKDLPIAICRPSIIGAAYRDPFPGWIDCVHGPAGIFIATGKGLLRVIRADPNGIADIVPVDFVNNMLLSVGWITAMYQTYQPLIYHCTSGTLNPMRWMTMYWIVTKSYLTCPFDDTFRRPYVIRCRPPSFWPLYHFVLHLIPAFFMDTLMRIMGKKPMLLTIYGKIDRALAQLHYFLQRTWKWSHDNHDKLLSVMSEEDKRLLNFDMRTLQWPKYIEFFCMGTKKYLMKEDLANLPAARRQITRLRNIHYTFNFVMFLLATRLLYLRSQIAREVWNSVLGICLRWMAKLAVLLFHTA